MVWVKICGTTNLEDARAAVEAGADAVGFVFAPSPRRVEPEVVREVASALPQRVEKVGVFVNESPEHIREVAEYAGLTAVQLHGDETVEFARQLAGQAGVKLRVFKAIPVRGGFGARMMAFADKGGVDAVLLDAAAFLRGGSGQSFDWRAVAEYMPRNGVDIPVIVAGGLNPKNVREAVTILRPWGVDVVSGVEQEPGKKDHEKVREFVRAAKEDL